MVKLIIVLEIVLSEIKFIEELVLYFIVFEVV